MGLLSSIFGGSNKTTTYSTSNNTVEVSLVNDLAPVQALVEHLSGVQERTTAALGALTAQSLAAADAATKAQGNANLIQLAGLGIAAIVAWKAWK